MKRIRRKYGRIGVTILVVLALLVTPMTAAAAHTEEPLLTIACLSDLHNQYELITGDQPRLRGTIVRTLTRMQEEEQVDVMLIGGDVTSDNYTTEAKVLNILQQVQSHTDPLTEKVLWITGNHDYNAGEGSETYNSAPYYDVIMKDSVGELPSDEAYYETYQGEDYLLAYHYVLDGFDFIGINTSPADMAGGKQHNNYVYAAGVFGWLEAKLAEIGKENTVFVLGHLPIAGSNSLNSNKGMLASSSQAMVDVLKQYPNVIYLYGHDHGGNSAYIKTDTAQRVTAYDTNGKVITDEPVEPMDTVLSDALVWKFIQNGNGYWLQNLATGEYLGVAANLSPTTEPVVWLPTQTGEGFTLQKEGGKSVHYSTNTLTFSHGDPSPLALYEKQTEGDAVVYRAVDAIEDGGEYVLVADTDRALTNKISPINSERMAAMDVVVTDAGTIESVEQTPSEDLPEGEPGFITSFMGSMRYYNNDIDGMVGSSDSQVVQALMIYVYADRIVLQMKNYGTQNGGAEEITPYVITRDVEYSGMVLPGDVDQNGRVEAADALMALQAATGKIALSEVQQQIADVDGTDGVSASDALLILQYATQKITSVG